MSLCRSNFFEKDFDSNIKIIFNQNMIYKFNTSYIVLGYLSDITFVFHHVYVFFLFRQYFCQNLFSFIYVLLNFFDPPGFLLAPPGELYWTKRINQISYNQLDPPLKVWT